MTTFTGNLEVIKKRLAQTLRELPPILGDEAVNFSLDRFGEEAWEDKALRPWKKRKNPTKWGKPDDEGRALLVKKGAGKQSIRVTKISEHRVWIGAGGSDVPYMRAHNFGFRGVVRQNVRPFTRRMKNGTTQNVRGFQRVIHQNIPQRQFMGNSLALRKRLQNVMREEIFKILK